MAEIIKTGPVGLDKVLNAPSVVSEAEQASQAQQAATQTSIDLVRHARQEVTDYKQEVKTGIIPL